MASRRNGQCLQYQLDGMDIPIRRRCIILQQESDWSQVLFEWL
ncbi:unnamed protein product, partial [Vitis vinifera]